MHPHSTTDEIFIQRQFEMRESFRKNRKARHQTMKIEILSSQAVCSFTTAFRSRPCRDSSVNIEKLATEKQESGYSFPPAINSLAVFFRDSHRDSPIKIFNLRSFKLCPVVLDESETTNLRRCRSSSRDDSNSQS
jgi:hypothetical protein